MANEKDKKGVIHNQDDELRYDSGEALKDQYEQAGAYEKDRIELRGIVFFTLGLILLIGVTFGLMGLLERVMENQAKIDKDSHSPMMMSREENLPPEPRLQAAPGFRVQREDGKIVNLELREPQSEYRELLKDWKAVWKDGRKDATTGTVITLPMEAAKNKVLAENQIKSRAPEQAAQAASEVRLMPSYQSSGRANDVRRQ